jgi:hypothetical protein
MRSNWETEKSNPTEMTTKKQSKFNQYSATEESKEINSTNSPDNEVKRI